MRAREQSRLSSYGGPCRAERGRVTVGWGNEPAPLIVCESRTFGGVLARTLAPEYLCPVTATGGQVGGFLHTNIAPLLIGNERRVLYVGDLDLAGRDIEGAKALVEALVRLAQRGKLPRLIQPGVDFLGQLWDMPVGSSPHALHGQMVSGSA